MKVDRSTLKAVGTVLFVLALVPFAVFTFPQVVGADHGYVVLSGSMSPTFEAGDTIIVRETSPSELEKGDVITYHGVDSTSQPNRVTHRIVGVAERDDGTYFETKGDANEEADRQLVPAEDVIGQVAFAIPLIGYVISFAGSDVGLLVFVVVPSLLLIVSEIWDLWLAATTDADN